MYLKEENNYPKAVAISVAIMGGLIALSFFIAIGTFKPTEEFGMGGMMVNYGTSVTGMGTDYTSIDEPSIAPDANNKQPDQVIPEQKVTPTNASSIDAKDVLTQNTEEAVKVNTKQSVSTSNSTPTTIQKEAKQVVNQAAVYKGNKNNGLGKGDGTGAEPGNQGVENGDPLTPTYGNGGSGFGDTPIPLRRFTNLITPVDDGQKTGKVAVRITINKNGIVESAIPGVKGTTLSDKDLWEKCKNAVMGATLSKAESGPDVQIGVVVFNFKVK